MTRRRMAATRRMFMMGGSQASLGLKGGGGAGLHEGQGQGQSVGGVVGGGFGQLEQALDHTGDGQFTGAAEADDGLFDAARGDFGDIESGFGGGEEADAAGFAHDEGGLEVLGKEQAFDGAGTGLVLADGIAEMFGDADQTTAAGEGRGAGDGAVGEGDGAAGLLAEDAPTGATQGGIDAEDGEVAGAGAGWRGGRIEGGRGGASGGAGAGLEFLELLGSDTHRARMMLGDNEVEPSRSYEGPTNGVRGPHKLRDRSLGVRPGDRSLGWGAGGWDNARDRG